MNERIGIAILKAFGLRVEEMNWYQWRIRGETPFIYWDWYHTQGSTVLNNNGLHQKFGSYGDPEDLAMAIVKYIYE